MFIEWIKNYIGLMLDILYTSVLCPLSYVCFMSSFMRINKIYVEDLERILYCLIKFYIM